MKGVVVLVIFWSFVFNEAMRLNVQEADSTSLSVFEEIEALERTKRSSVASYKYYYPWRPGHRYRFLQVSDAGYGSRIIVASGLVQALIAHRDIFGMFGPGRKK